MTIFKYLRVLLLSLYWQMPKAKEVDLNGSTEVSRDLIRKTVKKKRKLKIKRQVLPRAQRKVLHYHGYNSSSPKDHRFSNQKRLRRMYRNV